jgi:hypothetical protein
VREIFSRREQSLRKETLLVDRILDRMRSGAAPRDLPGDGVLQQSLRIACPAGGRSGGRFLVANETGAAARVSAAIGRPNGRGLRSLTGIGLRVEPEVLALEAGASSSMQVEVDLLRCVAPVGESIDVAVALEDGERRLGRIWIEVVVVEGER